MVFGVEFLGVLGRTQVISQIGRAGKNIKQLAKVRYTTTKKLNQIIKVKMNTEMNMDARYLGLGLLRAIVK